MEYIKDMDTNLGQLEKYTEFLDNSNIACALANIVNPNRKEADIKKAYLGMREYFFFSRQIDTSSPTDKDHSLYTHRWLFEKIYAHKEELKNNKELREIAKFFTSEMGQLFLQGAMTNLVGKPKRIYVAKLINDYIDRALYDKSETQDDTRNAFLASPEFAEIKNLARIYEDYRDKYGAKYIKLVKVKPRDSDIKRSFGLFYTYKPTGDGRLQPYIDVELDPEIGTIVEDPTNEKNQ